MTTRYTVAIGDIHGMSRIAETLLADLANRFSSSDARFIFLGDLIDRGGGSQRILEELSKFFEARPSSTLILGNHDEYLLKCFQGTLDDNGWANWMWNGGDSTLRSYAMHDDVPDEEVVERLNRLFLHHRRLLEQAVPMVTTDRHCFVHAGIDPKLPLDQQDDRTTRWIRNDFLDHRDSFEKIVVHGHTITESGLPEVRSNRIAIDTGSYQTKRISAAIFENDALAGFICAEQEGREARVRHFDAFMREDVLESAST